MLTTAGCEYLQLLTNQKIAWKNKTKFLEIPFNFFSILKVLLNFWKVWVNLLLLEICYLGALKGITHCRYQANYLILLTCCALKRDAFGITLSSSSSSSRDGYLKPPTSKTTSSHCKSSKFLSAAAIDHKRSSLVWTELMETTFLPNRMKILSDKPLCLAHSPSFWKGIGLSLFRYSWNNIEWFERTVYTTNLKDLHTLFCNLMTYKTIPLRWYAFKLLVTP